MSRMKQLKTLKLGGTRVTVIPEFAEKIVHPEPQTKIKSRWSYVPCSALFYLLPSVLLVQPSIITLLMDIMPEGDPRREGFQSCVSERSEQLYFSWALLSSLCVLALSYVLLWLVARFADSKVYESRINRQIALSVILVVLAWLQGSLILHYCFFVEMFG